MSETVEIKALPRIEPREKGPGRPKGSKNKITTLKIIAEQAGRERNYHLMQSVIDMIVDQARRGDQASQKLVWQAIMSNGIPNDQKISDKLEININTAPKRKEKIIPAEVTIVPTFTEDNKPNTPDEDIPNEDITNQ